MRISEKIRNRIILSQESFFSNQNISKFIEEGELDLLTDEVASKMQDVLESLVIDTTNDHNTQDTARRVAKMFIKETFSGRYISAPKVTSFPNAGDYDQLYVSGPIEIRSTCAHHMMPIVGNAYIGVFPGNNVIGLSKFNRIVDWFSSRPQIQEELTVQIADEIERVTEAKGVAIVIKANHFCLTHRGCRAHESDFTTSILRGVLRDELPLRQEFFSITSGMKGFSS